jgi:hypothetical protein
MKWAIVVIVAYGLLFAGFAAGLYAYRANQPDKKSFTIEGYITEACGYLVPADTHADRQWAKTMRYDCGIFPPGHKYGVFGEEPPRFLSPSFAAGEPRVEL